MDSRMTFFADHYSHRSFLLVKDVMSVAADARSILLEILRRYLARLSLRAARLPVNMALRGESTCLSPHSLPIFMAAVLDNIPRLAEGEGTKGLPISELGRSSYLVQSPPSWTSAHFA